MKSKKIFILLPDGVGLRNFAFSSFVEIGEQMGWEVVFWNQTPFDLTEFGYNEIKLQGKPRAYTDLLKRAKISAELDYFEEKFNDSVYQTYKFPSSNRSINSKIKNAIVSQLKISHRGEKGIQKLRKKLKASERKSDFYQHCKDVLEKEKPNFIFCTNQRPVNAIAPLTAAQDLGIPTSTFIFSWDNLPKATLIVEPDFYFVWSEYMKKELINYYPQINSDSIFITGSPQFEPHFNLKLRKTKEDFFEENNLDLTKEYICFSGDDKTTSPNDPDYLRDVSKAIQILNKNRETKLGILFRRCPVDFSDRYDETLENFKDLIVPVEPIWEQIGRDWNSALPTREDIGLQINTILHSTAVINLGSSMVFDFAILDKPCMYLKYNVENKQKENWSVEKIYDFVHFRSMPSGKEVIWLKSKEEIAQKLKAALEDTTEEVERAKFWFDTINQFPAERASERIWDSINEIVDSQHYEAGKII
ncbi:CDP-glycerol glycerophosphotransferase family protein [Gillisia hiemivivida]|uniref:UDP-glycosyltransferase n=1 Tax=Gillisia hiemivivida TaxID=291190 RepID=A0A5C6ZUI6_9FLAO|nr:UDP-glycosyltransferase [Gillisia hiemivivida]